MAAVGAIDNRGGRGTGRVKPPRRKRSPGRKDGKGKGGGKGKGNKQWSPLDLIDSRKQFKRMLKRRTAGTINPLLNPLRRERESEREATQGRQQDINQWYGNYDQRLQAAFDRTNAALNELISGNAQGSAQAQQTLAAALGSTAGADRELAERLGTTALPNAADEGALQTFASAEALRGQAGQQSGALLAGTGARQEMSGLGRLRSHEDEAQRVRSILNDVNRRIADVKASRPEIKEAMRKAIIDEELAKQGQKFQQKIAKQDLKLRKKTQREGQKLAERQQSHQEAIDFAQLRQQEQALKAEIKQAIASGKSTQAQGDAAIKKFQVARTQMEKFIEAQTKGKGKISTQEAQGLFRMLTKNYNIPPGMAMKVMEGSGIASLRRWTKLRKGKGFSWKTGWGDIINSGR